MNRMYPHTITLWCRTGETGGKASWTRTVLEGVRYREYSGSVRAPGGDRSSSTHDLIIPAATMVAYVPPAQFAGQGWTLRPKDAVCMGDVAGFEPAKDARILSEVRPIRIGSGIHHLEAS